MPLELPTQQRLRELFDYDPETGLLTWRGKASRKHHPGMTAGTRHHSGAWQVRINGTIFLVHRIIWKWLHDEEPVVVEHRDGDEGNNREANLRAADTSLNGQNRRKVQGKKLPKGVYRNRQGKFVAQMKHQGSHFYLGIHETPEAAHKAYVEMAVLVFGEFANDGVAPCL